MVSYYTSKMEVEVGAGVPFPPGLLKILAHVTVKNKALSRRDAYVWRSIIVGKGHACFGWKFLAFGGRAARLMTGNVKVFFFSGLLCVLYEYVYCNTKYTINMPILFWNNNVNKALRPYICEAYFSAPWNTPCNRLHPATERARTLLIVYVFCFVTSEYLVLHGSSTTESGC